MSHLKTKIKPILCKLSPKLRSLKDLKARQKFHQIEYIAFSQLSVKKACLEIGVSEDFFRKWSKRLIKKPHLDSLIEKSRRPLKSPFKTKKKVTELIVKIRNSKPYWGPENIHQRILEVFPKKKNPSISTIARTLKRQNLISKTYRKQLTKKHIKRYRQPFPGFMQMDFKYVPQKIRGKQFYQLSAIDHHSDWRFIRSYDNKGFEALEDFLRDLETEVPFIITEIQTDNDVCFTDKFTSLKSFEGPTGFHLLDEWCAERGIRHKLIPVGEKELNGKVENTHKQDDREFFSQSEFLSYKDLQEKTILNQKRWNERRKTKARKWKTPNEAVGMGLVRALAFLMFNKRLNAKRGLQITSEGMTYLEVLRDVKRVKVENRTRKISEKDRIKNTLKGLAYFDKYGRK